MSFAKYAIIDESKHVFEKEPDLYWKVKPPTVRDEVELSRFYQEGRVVVDTTGKKVVYPWSNIEIAIHQLALLFGGTNITKEGSDELVLSDKADVNSIEKYLGTLPTPVVKELWNALGEAVPTWGPGKTDPKN